MALPAAAAAADPTARFPLDRTDCEAWAQRPRLVVSDVPLGEGRRTTLDLGRFELFTPDVRIVRGTASGDAPLPRPPVALFAGPVAGEPAADAYVSISPYGVYGFVRCEGEMFLISSGRPGGSRETMIFSPARLPAGAIPWVDFTCGTAAVPAPTAIDAVEDRAGTSGPARDGPCRTARIAVETDTEFTSLLFAGDTMAAAAYATALLGAVSEIYARDVGMQLTLSFLRLWEDEDPWTATDIFQQLSQFRTYWNANMGQVQRHAAHFFSGRAFPNWTGVAYLGVLCNTSSAYALSTQMSGFFPYPLHDYDQQNHDVIVVAHELGHNCAATHTHELSPPVDSCGLGDCSQALGGTIMSYCHRCPPDFYANDVLVFHPRNINEQMVPYITNLTCDLVALPTIEQQPQGLAVCHGDGATLSVAATAAHGPPRFQWRRNLTNLVDGDQVSGATTQTLTIAPAGWDDDGLYDVLVTDDCGTTRSERAALALYCLPQQTAKVWRTVELGSEFGSAAAVSGDWAIVGAQREKTLAIDVGAVYAYRRDAAGWAFVQRLAAVDGARYDRFGAAIGLADACLVVGAPGDDGRGSAYVFEDDGASWHLVAKLGASDSVSGDAFGSAVAVADGWILVGNPLSDTGETNSGVAYAFQRQAGAWVERQRLAPDVPINGAGFGACVAAEGVWVVVGAPAAVGHVFGSGAAYVFQRTGETWVLRQKLLADDGAAGDDFGAAAALSGNTLLIGARRRDELGPDSGAAYVYEFGGSGWTLRQKLFPPTGASGDRFGIAVALADGVAIIGADRQDKYGTDAGAAYVYRSDGVTWALAKELHAIDASAAEGFGASLAAAGAAAVVGAPFDAHGSALSGSAYLLELSAGGVALTVPPGDRTVAPGQPASFSVVASGACGLSYQWYRGAAALADGLRIHGATTPTLVIDPALHADAGEYAVLVSNPCGSTLSRSAVLALTGRLGDLNCDGAVNNLDINHFVQALSSPEAYVADHDGYPYPPCNILYADFTGDGIVNNLDIDGFVNLLTAGVRGDLNCDGAINNLDIDHFVQALLYPAQYVADHDGSPYPACELVNGDFTGDGVVNNLDIGGFVRALLP